ncbi:serine/threonine-protein kinase [Prauserella oleivorans]|uniref:non-specific serine/threonine protein kinase n=1 Tax=Prauserella oleivorans TaxID=1478153 RepID=A0ABW5WA24_9PSEU
MSEDEGRLIAGRYRLQSRIGSGAMGVVWRAVDDRLDRTVAVKQLLLPPGLNEVETDKARQRAFREGRIAARLQHPNAISVYNVAEDAGQPVLVMEYLPSRSLSAVLAERRVLPPTEVARLGAQVASALTAAHAAGVIHRDVKPGNILLGDDGTTKITDFGISRAAGDITVTSTGLLAGTPAFLSPEAARGAEPGPASDVFSLGATLYAAVEGTPPFGAIDNEIALLHTVATGTTIPPRQAGPLAGPLQAMLQTEPSARPTMAQVAETLRTVADGGTVAPADPPTVPATAAVPPPPPRRPATRVDLHPAGPPPAAAPAPAAPAATRRSSTRVLVTALAVLTAAAIGILVAELLVGATGSSGSPRAGAPPTTEAPRTSEPPATTTTTSVAPSSEELEQAVADYYALLPDDPDSAWQELGPGLRAQGKSAYEDFWNGIERVSLVAGPRALDSATVQVQLDFTTDDGKVTREVHRLGMVTTSGTPRIDSDQLVSSRVVKKPSDEDKGGKDKKDDEGKDDKDGKDEGDEKDN